MQPLLYTQFVSFLTLDVWINPVDSKIFLYITIEDCVVWIGLNVGLYKPEIIPLIIMHKFIMKKLIDQTMNYSVAELYGHAL